jgi:hypothetical protein
MPGSRAPGLDSSPGFTWYETPDELYPVMLRRREISRYLISSELAVQPNGTTSIVSEEEFNAIEAFCDNMTYVFPEQLFLPPIR